MARWIDSPASPNSALASGMPNCTVLPKLAEMARTLGAAAPAVGAKRRIAR